LQRFFSRCGQHRQFSDRNGVEFVGHAALDLTEPNAVIHFALPDFAESLTFLGKIEIEQFIERNQLPRDCFSELLKDQYSALICAARSASGKKGFAGMSLMHKGLPQRRRSTLHPVTDCREQFPK
jgi:hypothetical protein